MTQRERHTRRNRTNADSNLAAPKKEWHRVH